MAFLSGFENDIFVSYARVDDIPTIDARGWVSTFVDYLKKLLDQRLGRIGACSLWMDRELAGNVAFTPAIMDAVRKSAVLVIVLSPGYLHSEWCRNEANTFLETLAKQRDPHRRVFVVEILETDRSEWPTPLQNLLGFKFWDSDGAPITRDKDRYFKVIHDIAVRIVEVLKQIASDEPAFALDEVIETLPIAVDGSSQQERGFDTRRDKGDYDVFLCHNSQDKPAVREIAKQLMARDLLPWLDEWDLRPGLPWQEALEEQIEQIRSTAVFVGESGFGPWQNMELNSFLREFAARRAPVIPVILKDCVNIPRLPTFIRGMHWVDFRKDSPDPLGNLIWGITGKRPNRNDSRNESS